jgi:hypothetical protein
MKLELIGARDVLHQGETQGDRIVRLQYIRNNATGHVNVVEIWHNDVGRVARITDRKLRTGETIPD